MKAPATVLIVEDDPAVADTFARMLRFAGYRVCTALDPMKALQHISAVLPDALLVDLRMAPSDGVALLRHVRQEHMNLPAAVITGDYFVESSLCEEIRCLGVQMYFKPLWCDDLVCIVESLTHDGQSPHHA